MPKFVALPFFSLYFYWWVTEILVQVDRHVLGGVKFDNPYAPIDWSFLRRGTLHANKGPQSSLHILLVISYYVKWLLDSSCNFFKFIQC